MREIGVTNRNGDYLLARAKQERVLAEQSTSPEAQVVHLRLADAYEMRASMEDVDAMPSDYVVGRAKQQSH
jgi:hypothetical protein